MKILLVGEYSRLHNSLKEGLLQLGHEVTIVASGDDFKNYPVDYSIFPKYFASNPFLKFCNKVSFKIFNIDLQLLERGIRFWGFLPKLKNYDVVQLVNSDAIETFPSLQIRLYKKLFAQNKKQFLLICGEETPIIEVLLKNNFKYSILTPFFEDKNVAENYRYTLKYVTPKYQKLYDFVAANCSNFIVSDLDYKLPMEQTKTNCILIPNPINIHKIGFIETPIEDKIVIFHGINQSSSIKKGNSFFEAALHQITQKYPEKVNIITVRSLPYAEYEKRMNNAHIVLDQVYGFDQGYNALEAMAKGKVVFTGAEKVFLELYNLQDDEVAINALPDVDYLVEKLSFLIENPEKITAIGKHARAFIEKEHDYRIIAKNYVSVWEYNSAV